MQMKRKILLVSSLGIGTVLLIGSTFAYQDWLADKAEKWQRIAKHFQMSWNIISWENMFPKLWENRKNEGMNADILDMTYAEFQAEYDKNITEDQFVEMQLNMQEREDKKAEAEEFRETIQIAIEQNDYEMFQEAIAIDDKGWKFSVIDTEAKFEKFVEMHEYLDDANTIRDELWLEDKNQSQKWMRMWKMK